MWTFKKQNAKGTPLRDAAAKLIANGLVSLQVRLARRLQHIERAFSRRQKVVLFLLFLMVSIGCCSYLLISALWGKKQEFILPAVDREGSVPPMLPIPPVSLPVDSTVHKLSLDPTSIH